MQETGGHWREELDALPVAVGLKGRDGRYLRANAAFARLAGLADARALEGRTDAELPWAAPGGVDAGDDRAVLSSGEPLLDAERSFRTPSGHLRTVRVSKSALRGAQGEPAFVLVCVQALPEDRPPPPPGDEHERLLAILDTLPYPFFAKDADLRYTACNRAFERFLGKPREEIVGHDVFEVSPPELAAVYHRADVALMEQKGTQVYEAKVRFADGTDHDVVFHKGVSLDGQGHASGIVGIYVDLTDRKRTERALQESERKYRQLVEDSLLGIYVIQGDQMVFCNERFAQMFGYPDARAVVGTRFQDFVDPADVERVSAEVRARQTGQKQSSHYEFRCHRRDGAALDVEVLGSRIDYQGQPAVQGTVLDVTERRRAEQERRRFEEQLRQAQKMEMVGQLAGGMAHDLNNLLLPVLGYSELLTKELPPGEAQEKVGQILRAAEGARDLVWRLMAFGRRQVLDLHRLDLREVVAAFERMLRGALREDIRLERAAPPGPATVRADPAQLQQVLMNLALNAQDAMPGAGTLSIRLSLAPPRGGEAPREALLEVADTGTGMDEAVRARLFEPFFTTKPEGKGTGLGLSTVFGIVQQHRGRILVDSAPGRGTTFKVFLPICEEGPMENHASDAQHGAPGALDRAKAEGGSETILLVEDNEMVRRTTAKILELSGYRVIAAASGEAGLAAAEAEPGSIDLLLTDVIMPGMNGMVLLQRLRSVRPDVGAVFMSGHDRNVVAQKGVLEDGVSFLQKPFMPEMLARKVREALQARRGARPGP